MTLRNKPEGTRSLGALSLRVGSGGLWYWYHLETCQKCRLSSSIPVLLTSNLHFTRLMYTSQAEKHQRTIQAITASAALTQVSGLAGQVSSDLKKAYSNQICQNCQLLHPSTCPSFAFCCDSKRKTPNVPSTPGRGCRTLCFCSIS